MIFKSYLPRKQDASVWVWVYAQPRPPGSIRYPPGPQAHESSRREGYATPAPARPKKSGSASVAFSQHPLLPNTQTRTSSVVQKAQPQNPWKADSSPSSRRAPVWEAASGAGAVDHPDSPAARQLPARAPRPTRRALDQTRDKVAAPAPAALGPRWSPSGGRERCALPGGGEGAASTNPGTPPRPGSAGVCTEQPLSAHAPSRPRREMGGERRLPAGRQNPTKAATSDPRERSWQKWHHQGADGGWHEWETLGAQWDPLLHASSWSPNPSTRSFHLPSWVIRSSLAVAFRLAYTQGYRTWNVHAIKKPPVVHYELWFLNKSLQIAHLQIAHLYCIVFFCVNSANLILSRYLLST